MDWIWTHGVNLKRMWIPVLLTLFSMGFFLSEASASAQGGSNYLQVTLMFESFETVAALEPSLWPCGLSFQRCVCVLLLFRAKCNKQLLSLLQRDYSPSNIPACLSLERSVFFDWWFCSIRFNASTLIVLCSAVNIKKVNHSLRPSCGVSSVTEEAYSSHSD